MAEREIRLGLVCFGGVSLAVYMAGITREIQILAEASRALDTPAERSLTGTAKEYAAALRRRAERDGVLTRVVVDVIAGTSAGGIDGIFLAKGLATGVDQAPLRDIWMQQGDLRRLVRGVGPMPLRALQFLGRAAFGGATAPLDGDLLLRHAYNGLRDMNYSTRSGASLPTGGDGTLDLFVTVTDVKGRPRSVSVWEDDRPVYDSTHRYVLALSSPLATLGRPGGLGPEYDAALAFAARATSSFPGAFPQVRLADVHAVLAKEAPTQIEEQMATLRNELFKSYTAEGADPEASWFFDGGVLDNFPFEHAISAIQRKPAGNEVERYLVVLQPDPGPPREDTPTTTTPTAHQPAGKPSWLATILSAFVGVRMQEPILDDLVRLRAANERLREVTELVERLEDRVQGRLSDIVSTVTPASDYAAVQVATQTMHDAAMSAAGVSWPQYLDLRLDAVTATLCEATTAALDYPGDSRQAAYVRAVLRRLVTGYRDASEQKLNDFLRRFDLPFRERRLRVAVQTVNDEYRPRPGAMQVPRELLDATKASLYDSLRLVWAIPADVGRTVGTPPVLRSGSIEGWLDKGVDELLAVHGAELEEWRDRVGKALEDALAGLGERSWKELAATLRLWDTDRASLVIRAFVGFPLWDISVFPLLAASQVQQFTPARVRHISPVEATKLWGSRDKLRGIPMHHFAAFLDRESRENDYVWGRLDAAECLLRMVEGQTADEQYAAAFEAVVDQESDLGVLDPRRGDNLRSELEILIADLRASAPGDDT